MEPTPIRRDPSPERAPAADRDRSHRRAPRERARPPRPPVADDEEENAPVPPPAPGRVDVFAWGAMVGHRNYWLVLL